MEKYGVYARLRKDGAILAIDSDCFLKDLNGWIKIDVGGGYRFSHAQTNYIPGPLDTAGHIPLYKWDGAKVIPRTPDEIAADRAKLPPPPKTPEERLQALETLGENLNAGFKRLEKLFGGVRK